MTILNEGKRDNLQKLATLLTQAVRESAFPMVEIDAHGPRLRTLQPSELRDLYHDADPENQLKALEIWPQLKGDLTERLSDCLTLLLGEYIVGNRIGNGFVPFGGGLTDYEITEFVSDAVRAAAIQGTEATVDLLRKWAADERAPYQLCAVLSGVTSSEFLGMEGGIRFTPLSASVDNGSVHLPPRSTFLYGLSDLRNGLKVSIDCTGGPSLRKIGDSKLPERSWAHGPLPENVLDIVCEALSLGCDQYIKWWLKWVDCGEAKVFRLGATYGHSRRRDEGHSYGTATLTEGDLPYVHEILMKRLNGTHGGKSLDIAINRWMNSKGRLSLTDKLIEARIALEALYLPDSGPELRFRLATRGAWDLGADFEERRKNYRTLRDVYDLASNAVHRGEVEDTSENRDVLKDAQDLCRKGILKRLHETETPDWIELTLGKELEATP